ncbi:DUF2207 domain-containing protein, partial [Spinactinospora alkalitolerans]
MAVNEGRRKTGTRTGRAPRPWAVAGLLLAAPLSALPSAAPAAAEGERAVTSYDVDVAVGEDGVVSVRETLTYRFGQGPADGMFRSIPAGGRIGDGGERDFGLTGVEVESADGVEAVDIEDNGAETVVRIGQEQQDPRLTGEKTFVIGYDYETLLVEGAEGRPRLFLDVVGPEWEIPIESAHAEVEVPGGIDLVDCYAGEPSSRQECTSAESAGSAAAFSNGPVEPGEAFSVDVTLSEGSAAVPTPRDRDASGGGAEDGEDRGVGFGFLLSTVFPLSSMFCFPMVVVIIVFMIIKAGSGGRGGGRSGWSGGGGGGFGGGGFSGGAGGGGGSGGAGGGGGSGG